MEKMNDVINEDNLFKIGFKKHYANEPLGFYMLETEKKKLEDNFIFTVGFDMTLSLGSNRHSAIKKLPRIKTITQIKELYHILMDEVLEDTIYLFDVKREDFYEYSRPKDRTRKRLEEMARLGMSEIGSVSFGIEGVMSGFHIERVWDFDEKDFNGYIDWVKSKIKERSDNKN